MKGGYTAVDPRLGRVPFWDERNRDFPIGAVLRAAAPLVTRTWRLDASKKLDQAPRNQTEAPGTCVGHGWAHRRNAAPIRAALDHADALAIFRYAQNVDPWPGAWPEYDGTSVLAGAKAMQYFKWVTVYRWATTVDDILAAVSQEGPVVMGTWWTNDMFEPDARGFIRPTGDDAGGHCWIIRGINVRSRYVVATNSWGTGWGLNGDFKMTWADLGTLFAREGEACVPTER
jgi:hypothetical protein